MELLNTIKQPKAKRALIILGTLCLVLFIGIGFIHRPAKGKIALLNKQIKDEEALNALTKSIEDAHRSLTEYRLRRGDNGEVGWLISQATKIARQEGVKILSIEPQNPIINDNFKLVSCKINTESDYDETGAFVSAIESQKEFIRIEKVGMVPAKASFTLTGFFLPNEDILPDIDIKPKPEYPVYAYKKYKGKKPFDLPDVLKDSIYAKQMQGAVEEEPIHPQKVSADPVLLPSMRINGIVWGGNVPAAIIDNKVYREGDSIKDAKVVKIVKEGVWFLYKEKDFLMKVEKQ